MMFLIYYLGGVLANPINASIRDFNALSTYDVPTLSTKQIASLQSGELVSIIDGGNGDSQPKRGIAYKLFTLDMPALWLACQDDHFTLEEGTQFHPVKTLGVDHFHWYTYIDLPKPLSDRHWVVDSWNNHDIAEKSNDQMWEHPWTLVTDWEQPGSAQEYSKALTGVTPAMINKAVKIPYSQGAWGLINLGKKRLMIYHATASAGGLIPERLLLRLMLGTLEGMFLELEKNADTIVPEHYVSGHTPMYGGNGIELPHY